MNKILIVDDEMDICYFLSRNLEKRKVVTEIVHNLADAEKKIREAKPSILLLDNHLPDGFGINFIAKAKDINPQLSVVMITAHDSIHDRTRAYSNGADFFLAKPFTIAEVNKVIDMLLKEEEE
ncbi:MAG: response regulator [Chitinophagaceae bacterium]